MTERYSKEKFIKMVSKKSDIDVETTKAVYSAIDNLIYELLCGVDEDGDVEIKLFDGVTVYGDFIKGKERKNNLTGEMIFVQDKIKPKFEIKRSYVDKLNGK